MIWIKSPRRVCSAQLIAIKLVGLGSVIKARPIDTSGARMTSIPHIMAWCAVAMFGMALGGCVAFGSSATGGRPESETAAVGWSGDKTGRIDPAMVAQGRQIAERECASCHAIGRKSASPMKGVPPLRDVLALYDADNLAYRFIEGMRVGHDDMPLFDFDVRTADALIAYIGTISGPSE